MTRPVQRPELQRIVANHTRRLENLERKRPDVGPLTLPEETGTLSTDFILCTFSEGLDRNVLTEATLNFANGNGSSFSMSGGRISLDAAGLIAVSMKVTYGRGFALDSMQSNVDDDTNLFDPEIIDIRPGVEYAAGVFGGAVHLSQTQRVFDAFVGTEVFLTLLGNSTTVGSANDIPADGSLRIEMIGD